MELHTWTGKYDADNEQDSLWEPLTEWWWDGDAFRCPARALLLDGVVGLRLSPGDWTEYRPIITRTRGDEFAVSIISPYGSCAEFAHVWVNDEPQIDHYVVGKFRNVAPEQRTACLLITRVVQLAHLTLFDTEPAARR